VPLGHFIQHSFQNWSRACAKLLGSVTLWVDYSLPLDAVRLAASQIIESSPRWDKLFWSLQVIDANDRAVQLRILATAADSSKAWDLRCEIREKLLAFIQEKFPRGLPRLRAELEQTQVAAPFGRADVQEPRPRPGDRYGESLPGPL
jgi:hypothetical protein